VFEVFYFIPLFFVDVSHMGCSFHKASTCLSFVCLSVYVLCLSVCLSVSLCACLYMRMHIIIWTYIVCMSVWVCACLCMCVCARACVGVWNTSLLEDGRGF